MLNFFFKMFGWCEFFDGVIIFPFVTAKGSTEAPLLSFYCKTCAFVQEKHRSTWLLLTMLIHMGPVRLFLGCIVFLKTVTGTAQDSGDANGWVS